MAKDYPSTEGLAATDDEGLRPLRGRRILIVEDEAIISFLLEDMVGALGCEDIVHAASVKSALEEVDATHLDAAVLDVNLGGETAYPVAEKLDAAHIPYVFTTGMGRGVLRADLANHPVVQKPFNLGALAAALDSVLPAHH